MSTVRLTGGLGNQLFQICFGESLKTVTGDTTIYDAIEYKYRSAKATRRLELPKTFDLIIENKSNRLISHLPEILLNHTEKKSKSVSKASYNGKLVLKEGVNIYDSSLPFSKNAYYIGNFISHKYWVSNPISVIAKISNIINEATKIENQPLPHTIGIHVRRGDYINNPKVRNLHGYCTDEYFIESIIRITNENSNIKNVLLATDSFSKTENLRLHIKQMGLTVNESLSEDPLTTLNEISKAGYFIGSNSTFSWWAAALSPKKISVFPSEWFITGNYGFSSQDFFPFPVTNISNALTSKAL